MENIVKKFKIVYLLFLLAGLAAIGKVVYIQFFSDTIVTADDMYKTEKIEATRGSILSKDGRPLATSIPYFEIRMDCSTVNDTIFDKGVDGLSKELSGLFGNKSSSDYRKELLDARKKGNKYKLLGNRTVDFIEMEQVKGFPIFSAGRYKGGLIIVQKNKRTNPYGKLAYRTIGYVNEVGGGVGIENSFNYYLKGKDGEQKIHRLPGNEWIPVSGEDAIPAVDGYDVQTTLDIDIQEAAETALRYQLSLNDVFEGGTAIVMEVKTGAVRAIANMKKMKNGEYDESYNYAIGFATEPGSTMKLASLLCLLEDGYVTLDTPIDGGDGRWYYNNILFSDTKKGGYGMLDVKTAFEKSSNVCFSKLVVDHYKGREEDFVARWHNMKINEKFNLEIEGEGRGLIYSPEDKGFWESTTLPMMGIGYSVALTPLHTLTFYNAVANDGKMMKPYFVENYQRNGVIETSFEPQELSGSICSKGTIIEAKKALRGVVEHGTAKNCNDPRYSISGKTGTAQIADGKSGYIDKDGYKRHQASFAGFFPSEKPKYSCIVVMYTGKTRGNFYGGSWASPVFKMIADKIYSNNPDWNEPLYSKGIVPPDTPSIAAGRAKEGKITLSSLPIKEKFKIPDSGWIDIGKVDSLNIGVTEIKIEMGFVPNVINMGLKDALYILENEGYSVNFSGKGRVISQSPIAGSYLEKKGNIEIQLSE